MSTIYVNRHRGATTEGRRADLQRERKAGKLMTIRKAADFYMAEKPYARQAEEVKGLARRYNRVMQGIEKP